MKYIKICLPIFLVAVILVSAAGCSATRPGSATVRAIDLMDGVSSNHVDARPADAAFTDNVADFSIELFKISMEETENSMISPLSVMLALSMAANGARGETLAQMEALLGRDIPLEALNEYLYSYVSGLQSEDNSKLHIANSIWFRDYEDILQVEPDFLQRNADYYGAAAYRSAFDAQTLKDINNWVKANTDGMIDEMLSEIKAEHMLFLINAITFDAEWLDMYSEYNISKGDFTDINGVVKSVDLMRSSEYLYINEETATGFIKPYVNGGYSFVALLPKPGISIYEYVESLTGTGFLDMIDRAKGNLIKIETFMPKFEYEYEITMNGVLESLGMTNAFDRGLADFRDMAASPVGNLFIGEVLHKTFISVDERGTRAGAATSVNAELLSGPLATVRLDRPFVFAIIDDATNIPIFMGTLMTV